jgi:hypothetical protein
VIAVPAIALSTTPGFHLVWIWYLSAGAVALQLGIVLTLLRREFRLRLGSMPSPVVAKSIADSVSA